VTVGRGSVIGAGAPLLGSLFLGPLGAKAGEFVASLVGANPEDPSDILAKLSADSEAALKLKQFEMQNATRLQELKFQEMEAHLKDVQSARQREVEVVKATGKRDVSLIAFAWLIVLGFFGLIAINLFVAVPDTSRDIVNQLYGAMVVGFATVISYFFGSSKSSADKNVILASRQ
jgi:ABC-type Na+ efflux pump permease subunit